MKKHLPTLIMILVFIIGLAIMLYPVVSNVINIRHQSVAVINYAETVSGLSEDTVSKVLNEAVDYNNRLEATVDRFFNPEQVSGYASTLLVDESKIMATISIDRIGVNLSIYHGTDDNTLNSAVGHLEGTSLPIGGESTHSVLVAHRGLPSAKLFTDLDKLEEGDIFRINVLGQELLYCVDQILIVEPDEVDQLQIVKGQDYCTLLTCTPYGINTHRLLVRGRRIADVAEVETLYVMSNARVIDPIKAAPFVAIPLLLLLVAAVIVGGRGKHNKHDIDKIVKELMSDSENNTNKTVSDEERIDEDRKD